MPGVRFRRGRSPFTSDDPMAKSRAVISLGRVCLASVKGGDKLEGVLKGIAARLSKASTVEVGFMSDATYPDGTSVAMVAAINEFGRPDYGQPPRPFFRNMIAAHSKEWPDAIAANLKATDYDAEKTLQLLGEGIKGQLQQ